MVPPIRPCAAHRSAFLLLMATLTAGLSLPADADTLAQRQDIAAAARQLDALERLVAHSAANATATPGERYHFDYTRLSADLARVRGGLQDFLTPPRAQPRDSAELAGQYRTEQATDHPDGAEPKP
ncbi:TPA: RAQPRD family integrative conjugative element protein [Pseudomonas putida]|nr:RAQPRD family integrative conjugative element protein [Pseudomonas putida]HDS1803037.1 RAQPRD family integrative conjugative element protein [Pseudomonas putida]HDS1808971.1 RAQPRD family integrative conjugative element protein [Pseudomonas putida]